MREIRKSGSVGEAGLKRHGKSYTGTKAETPETDKGTPKAKGAEADTIAEEVEGRRSTQGNSLQQNMLRTQGRERMQSALERVRRAAKKDKRWSCPGFVDT